MDEVAETAAVLIEEAGILARRLTRSTETPGGEPRRTQTSPSREEGAA